jgi:hypothetical protein
MVTPHDAMNDTIAQGTNPRLIARLAGFFYLLTGGTAFAFFTRGRLFGHADAAVLGANILGHEPSYRTAVAADLFGVASYLVVMALLYRLFRPVSRSLAVLAAFCGLTGCVIQAGACCFDLVAIGTADAVKNSTGVNSEQIAAVLQVLVRLHAQAFNIAILFFGFYCILIGILALRSAFLPRILGVLMTIAGLAYVVNNVAVFLLLPGAGHLSSYATTLGGLGELSLLLWLLIFGVNAQKWRELTRADI